MMSELKLSIHDMTKHYCKELYKSHQNYQDVAKITDLDWRTVKKYITED